MNCTIIAIITQNTQPCVTFHRQAAHCNHTFCCWYNCHIQIKSATRFPAIWLWVKWCSVYACIYPHIAQEVDLRYPKVCDSDNIVHHKGILDWLFRHLTLHCWPRKSYTGQSKHLGGFWPYTFVKHAHSWWSPGAYWQSSHFTLWTSGNIRQTSTADACQILVFILENPRKL